MSRDGWLMEPIWDLTDREGDDFLEAIGRGEPRGGSMESGTPVDKAKLIEAVRSNMTAHRATYEQAMAGYREVAMEWLKARLREYEEGKAPRLWFQDPPPEDHTEDYERILEKLQWSVGDEVTLTDKEFDHYVMDDWGWKEQWFRSTGSYIK